MRNSISFLGRSLVGEVPPLLVAMALFLASSGYGADAPDRSPMAMPEAGIGASGGSPSISGVWRPAESSVEQPVGELFFRVLSPVEPGDKGSTYTDGALGREGAPEPTASEREKLAAARAAIESAERAGTLYGTASLLLQGPRAATESRLGASNDAGSAGPPPAAGKPDGGRASSPALLRPDAAACVGIAVKPLQLQGPVGLSPSEEAKAAALKPSDPNRSRRERKDGTR